ncbi:uncharacterized protein EURHEDRAFT_401574 [Aspergillus ruber CBS 135680]|uniref:Uncharacterized protein n=1 Tax=Aspergillus ruber (strain CBS 135680) TaxID=1388766 RepID=A0A017SHT0_ASPRC|nr:uncharacterized protein EURHEDRAFT_401574 [Aspergillus ruber CBS 135680]EYE96507.1 hypothetical protein EURHEDRAFT_401574 [Aspergillus ruber CBS 135680]
MASSRRLKVFTWFSLAGGKSRAYLLALTTMEVLLKSVVKGAAVATARRTGLPGNDCSGYMTVSFGRAQLQRQTFVCLAESEAENFPGRALDARIVHIVLSRPYPWIIGTMYGVQAIGY